MTSDPAVVLLVDDEPSLLLLLGAALRRAGFGVLSAADGAEGERLACDHRPDVVVSDVMMPPPDGVELRRRLAANPATAGIPFIFLTARSNMAEVLANLQGGVDAYVTKPFEREELIARVRAVLRRPAWPAPAGLNPQETYEAKH
jgi:two-component system OmpR family response regulator